MPAAGVPIVSGRKHAQNGIAVIRAEDHILTNNIKKNIKNTYKNGAYYTARFAHTSGARSGSPRVSDRRERSASGVGERLGEGAR